MFCSQHLSVLGSNHVSNPRIKKLTPILSIGRENSTNYEGDVTQLRSLGFDAAKFDNCGAQKNMTLYVEAALGSMVRARERERGFDGATGKYSAMFVVVASQCK